MKIQKTLKEQNQNLLWYFFSFNVLLYYSLAISPYLILKDFDWRAFLIGQGIWLLVIPLILFIVNGVLSSNQKAIICFWRIKNPLPACRSFSKYINEDDRIDKLNLESKFSPFPVTAKEQNSLWYKIYKVYQED